MLRKGHLLVVFFIGISLITILSISAEQSLIPAWIKTTASFWVNDQVSDQEFLNAIQFLINNGMIEVSPQLAATTPTYSPPPTPSFTPSGVASYHFSSEGVFYRENMNKFEGFFVLRTDSGKTVTGNGELFLKITNSDGQEVFNDKIYIRNDLFETFVKDDTNEKYKAVKWNIPIQKIFSRSVSTGTLSMIFDATGDQAQPEEILVSINNLPNTGGSSIGSSSGSNEWKVGKDMNVGPFKITIDKVSFVEDQGYPYGEYLRVDMSIYNKRNEIVELQFSQTTLTDSNKFVYDSDFSSRYKLEIDYPPDTSKKGFLLFEDVPKGTRTINLYFEVVVISDIYISDNYYYNDDLEIKLS